MGQKANPNILRLGINKTWKTEFFEKKNKELANYIFNDLQIKEYIERFLLTQKLSLHDYKIQYSDSIINIYLSYFIGSNFIFNGTPSSQRIKIKTKEGKKLTSSIVKLKSKLITQRYFQKVIKKDRLMQTVLNRNFASIKALPKNYQKVFVVKSNQLVTLNRKISTINVENIHCMRIENSIQKMLEGLSFFVQKKYNIVLTLNCLNKNFELTVNQSKLFKKNFMFLQKFRNSEFFREGINVCFATVRNKKTSHLLAVFIGSQLKTVKRHKFLLSFLKRTLDLFVASNFSELEGVKIVVKGRLNGAPRARHKILTTGRIPTQTIDAQIDYAQVTVQNANGSYGIKVWIVGK